MDIKALSQQLFTTYSEQEVRSLISELQGLLPPVGLVQQLRAVGVRVSVPFATCMQEMGIDTLEAFMDLTTHDIWERPNAGQFSGALVGELVSTQRGVEHPEQYTPNAMMAMLGQFAE